MGEPQAAAAKPAERIGRYEVVMQIAKGGMATVSLCRAEGVGGFDRYVAVKLTAEQLREDPEFQAHLIDEAKLVAHLRHLNIVPVLDVAECDRGVFLVMEYIPGDSLAGLLRRAREAGTPLPARVGLRILVDALAGLHAAHEHTDEEGTPLGLVHRDFSPANIMVGTDGIARLTDFGIAKAASRASNTVAGNIKGKISYVAPEQARGDELDRRCDLWAAGVIAWELLAGKKLHGTSEKALIEIATVEPPHVRTANPDVPEALDAAIAAVLKLDRDARTPTAAQLAKELGTAAKAGGFLAETEEVAELVTRLTQKTLAERKETIARARRQRMTSSPEIILAPASSSSSSIRRSLPSLPEVPVSAIPALRDQKTLEERASEPIKMIPDELAAKPTVVPPAAPSSEEVAFPLGPPSSNLLANPKVKLGLYGLVGVVSVLVLVFTAIAAIGSKPDEKSLASASASTSATPPPIETTVSAPVTAPKPTRNVPMDEGVWPTMLEISGDAPIASIKINGRASEISAPTQKVSLEIDPEDSGKDLKVVATSADGRVTTGTASNNVVTLSFADAKVPPPPPPAPKGPPPKGGGKKKR